VVLVLSLAATALLIWLIIPPRQHDTLHRAIPHCKNNLKQIALALHVYHDAWGSFPPAYVADANGKPMHSWRVLILPYIDEKGLYERYDFSKPWDAPENAGVLAEMPDVFTCPSDRDAAPNTTSYAGVFGPGCVFDPERPVRIRDIKDGTTVTLMVGEVVGVAIPWTKPEDIDVTQHPTINQPGGFGSRHEGGCQFVTADGATHFLDEDVDQDKLRRLFLRDDGTFAEDPFAEPDATRRP
jgi:hypothetical protein